MPLTEARQIPIGSFLDTRDGILALRTARNDAGVEQPGRFAAGLFQVLQSRRQSAKGLTELPPQRLSRRVQTAATRPTARGAALSASDGQTTAREREGPLPHARPALGGDRARNALGDGGSLRRDADHGEAGDGRGPRDFRLKESITVTAGKSYLARAPD